MSNRIGLFCIDIALSIMILQSVDSSMVLYVIGIICILAAKIALIWNDQAKLTTKAIIITSVLSIAGGYIGYLIGLIWFPDREMVRLGILLLFVYLGDTILIGLKAQFPELYKSILKGGANAIIKKIGGDKEENEL